MDKPEGNSDSRKNIIAKNIYYNDSLSDIEDENVKKFIEKATTTQIENIAKYSSNRKKLLKPYSGTNTSQEKFAYLKDVLNTLEKNNSLNGLIKI